MIITKLFLALVGFLYLGLAVWCSVSPVHTSGKVGFELKPGSGQSEFLVIYGGLELAMSLMFLLPLIRSEYLASSLLACLLIHVCLVAFRTVSLVLYRDISSTTYNLAIGEWAILIVGMFVWYFQKKQS